jgi:VCBS repeat-containing protein
MADKNGKFNYTPNKNFIGTDTFKCNVNNGTSNPNTATVTITVTNIPPVANNMNINTNGNTIYKGKLNVSDIDGDPLRYNCITRPAHGTISLNHDGTFIYTPKKGFKDNDSFTYKVSDGYAESNVANVTLTVMNNPPVANNMNISTFGNTLILW